MSLSLSFGESQLAAVLQPHPRLYVVASSKEYGFHLDIGEPRVSTTEGETGGRECLSSPTAAASDRAIRPADSKFARGLNKIKTPFTRKSAPKQRQPVVIDRKSSNASVLENIGLPTLAIQEMRYISEPPTEAIQEACKRKRTRAKRAAGSPQSVPKRTLAALKKGATKISGSLKSAATKAKRAFRGGENRLRKPRPLPACAIGTTTAVLDSVVPVEPRAESVTVDGALGGATVAEPPLSIDYEHLTPPAPEALHGATAADVSDDEGSTDTVIHHVLATDGCIFEETLSIGEAGTDDHLDMTRTSTPEQTRRAVTVLPPAESHRRINSYDAMAAEILLALRMEEEIARLTTANPLGDADDLSPTYERVTTKLPATLEDKPTCDITTTGQGEGLETRLGTPDARKAKAQDSVYDVSAAADTEPDVSVDEERSKDETPIVEESFNPTTDEVSDDAGSVLSDAHTPTGDRVELPGKPSSDIDSASTSSSAGLYDILPSAEDSGLTAALGVPNSQPINTNAVDIPDDLASIATSPSADEQVISAAEGDAEDITTVEPPAELTGSENGSSSIASPTHITLAEHLAVSPTSDGSTGTTASDEDDDMDPVPDGLSANDPFSPPIHFDDITLDDAPHEHMSYITPSAEPDHYDEEMSYIALLGKPLLPTSAEAAPCHDAATAATGADPTTAAIFHGCEPEAEGHITVRLPSASHYIRTAKTAAMCAKADELEIPAPLDFARTVPVFCLPATYGSEEWAPGAEASGYDEDSAWFAQTAAALEEDGTGRGRKPRRGCRAGKRKQAMKRLAAEAEAGVQACMAE